MFSAAAASVGTLVNDKLSLTSWIVPKTFNGLSLIVESTMKIYNSGFYFEVEIVLWKSIIPAHHLTPAWKKSLHAFMKL